MQDIVVSQYVFRELQTIVGANPALQDKSGWFLQWIATSHACREAVAIRRHAKSDEKSISLLRILQELAENPTLVSRAEFVQRYTDKGLPSSMGNGDFDAHVGKGKDRLCADAVRQEIEEFKTAAKGIEHIVDRQIAHVDRRGRSMDVPTFAEVERCTAIMERLVLRYELLLTGGSSPTLMPMFQFDWKDVLTIPWLRDGRS